MRARQSRYKTVGDGSDEGNSSHWIVLFCQRYWLAGIGGHGSGRRALGGQDDVVVQSAKITCFWVNPIPLPSSGGSNKSEKLKASP